MRTEDVFRVLIEFPWVVFLMYWFMGAIKTRPTRLRESSASRYSILLIEVAGFVLLFADSAGIGWLGNIFLPRTLAGALLGVALTWLGVGLAIWAALSPGGILERADYPQRGPSTHPHWPLFSIAAPHLFRRHSCRHRFGSVDRQVERSGGSLPGGDRLLLKGGKGRKDAQPAIWRRVPRAQKAHWFSDPTLALRPTSRLAIGGADCARAQFGEQRQNPVVESCDYANRYF
jgi:hypothetical protein